MNNFILGLEVLPEDKKNIGNNLVCNLPSAKHYELTERLFASEPGIIFLPMMQAEYNTRNNVTLCNGWPLVLSAITNDDNIKVIVHQNFKNEYVVHYYNIETGGASDGSYLKDSDSALKEFERRVALYN